MSKMLKKVKKKKLPPRWLPPYVWAVAYIDNEQLPRTAEYLSRYPEYENITAFIPTVKILTKTFKNKSEFEEVPLLFNYGFFKIPRQLIQNHEFFAQLKERVPVIYHWVKDVAGAFSVKPVFALAKPTKREYVPYAIATDEEIQRIVEEAAKTTIYSGEDLKTMIEGSFITLKGYPWEDMQAKILKIDARREEVKVELILDNLMKEVTVSFHNVFYTIYSGGHKIQPMKEQSIEEREAMGKKNKARFQVEI